ncbi:T9SS type A sorting domain-containing protein [Kordia sp. YSTF-M3]|uniref:T9SS type A sorting domain-containing protein n=1 Tax=Kordia aestuariivivens TaxID=2759037 RepID=A0ABR7QD02_9FLAO|nr:T9SS type A sorting domain-containing protein [Kordia aestuariivivens]MBC8756451.1 T9SS type A sorting domain-containing protein [Kordia aestuariivivens]
MKKAVLIIFTFISTLQLFAQPSNDQCVNAITLSCGTTLNNQDTINAVLEDSNSCIGNLIGEDVWYKFEGTGDEINFVLVMSNGTAYTEIYESTNNECSGISIGNCIYGAGFINGSISTTTLFSDIGTTYYIRVGNKINDGPIEFSITTNCTPCSAPAGLGVTNITTASADLTWVELGAATAWNVEWGLTGFTQGTGNAINNTPNNPQNITGLTSGATYDFYVQADCGPDGTSTWVGPYTFIATCLATPPYAESFEDFTVSEADFLEGNCWTGTPGSIGGYNWEVAAPTDTSSTDTGPAPNLSDGNYMFTEASAALGGEVTNLISPSVDLSTLADPEMTFKYHMFGVDMGTLEILIDNGSTTTTVFTVSGEQQATENDPFITATIDLSNYVGQTIQVTFKAIMGPGFRSDIAIDDITFGEAILGVEEFENATSLTYYPNPVENILTLNSLSKIQQVRIYNMLGQEVKLHAPNTKEAKIDLSNLQSGTYFAQVTIDDAFKTIRILKN